MTAKRKRRRLSNICPAVLYVKETRLRYRMRGGVLRMESCSLDHGHRQYHRNGKYFWSHWPKKGQWKARHFVLCICGSRFVDHVLTAGDRFICVAPECAPKCRCKGFSPKPLGRERRMVSPVSRRKVKRGDAKWKRTNQARRKASRTTRGDSGAARSRATAETRKAGRSRSAFRGR